MKVADRTYVSIDYTLTLETGEVADQSSEEEPLGFLVGTGQIIPGLEKALLGMEAGDSAQVTVAAAEGYGEAREELLRDLPRENFPDDLKLEPGIGFEAKGPHGPVTFRVREVRDDTVLADFNHPLAGQQLQFDVKIAEVREPTAEELATLMGAGDGCSPSACSGCGGGCG
jgi:FKBP-type peptidyl-prolyl cis-trans isomerase SlyD